MLHIHCKIALFFFHLPLWLVCHFEIRNGVHAHYVGLVVAYTWNREKQMFVALGKEFDMTDRAQHRGPRAMTESQIFPIQPDLTKSLRILSYDFSVWKISIFFFVNTTR